MGGTKVFVIVTYDINSKRVSKVMKICRKYLTHVQRSVFEGMITDAKLNRLKNEVKNVIETDSDQIRIYKIESLKFASKDEIGIVKNNTNIL